MADITFTCPYCEQALEAPDDMLGLKVVCPGCQCELQIPKEIEGDDSSALPLSTSLPATIASPVAPPLFSESAEMSALIAQLPASEQAEFARIKAEAAEAVQRSGHKPMGQKELKDAMAEMESIASECEARIRKRETTDKIYWRNDDLELDGDRIILRRRGVANALAAGLNGERTIFISSLTSVQMKIAGLLSPGYILFSYAGSRPFFGGLIEATQDPDAFIFGREQNDRVAAVKAKIEKLMRDSRKTVPASNPASSLSDEIRKLADLRQQGSLTQEEFEQAKKKLIA